MEWTAAFAAIANDGVWNKPFLVSAVRAADGSEISSVRTESKRVMKSTTAREVYGAMRGVGPLVAQRKSCRNDFLGIGQIIVSTR